MKIVTEPRLRQGEAGGIPPGWDVKILKEVTLKIFSGGTPNTRREEFWNGDLPWLSSGETNQSFIRDTLKRITREGVEHSSTRLAEKEDIVVAGAGQGYTRGQSSFCLIDAYINQSVVALRANKEKLLPLYLFYNLLSRYDELRRISDAHSSRGSLTTKLLADLSIKLPPIDEQKKISEILSNLDFKIELNQQMNKTLEAIAQAIFKHWFVDFEFPNEGGRPYRSSGGAMVDSELGMTPRQWKIESLYGCATYVNGDAFRDTDFSLDRSGLPIIKIGELKSGITSQTDFTKKGIDSRYRIYDGDILFSWSGSPDTSIDTFMWAGGQGYLNQHIFKVVVKGSMEREFVFFLLKSLRKTFIEIARNKQTTGLGHVTSKDLKRLLVKVPSTDIMKMFGELVKPILDRMLYNNIESLTLIQLRDSLLPQLMSGTIRVSLGVRQM